MKINDIMIYQINEEVLPLDYFTNQTISRSKQHIDNRVRKLFSNGNQISDEELSNYLDDTVNQIIDMIVPREDQYENSSMKLVQNFNEKFKKMVGTSVGDYLAKKVELAAKNNPITEAPYHVKKISNNGYGPVLTKKKGKKYPVSKKKQLKKKSNLSPLAMALMGMSLAYGAGHYKLDVPTTDTNATKPTITYVDRIADDEGGEVTLYNKDGSEIKSSGTKPTEVKKEKTKEPFFKIGKPYTIAGEKFTPKYDPNYKKVGLASWYGPGFHGELTANHDVFDENEITAAHPTLPIPSKVWVTNLENGKKILVTVNDRGPYKYGRSIDLSKAAAEELGFKDKGTAKVKIEYDKRASEDYLKQVGLYDQFKKVIASLN